MRRLWCIGLAVLAACAVNPVPTPASGGGAFTFGGGGFDAAKAAADTADATGAAGITLADAAAPPGPDDEAAAADGAASRADTSAGDAEPADGARGDPDALADSVPADTAGFVKDAKADAVPDATADTKPDAKPDAKLDAKLDAQVDTVVAPTFGAVYTGVIKKYGCAANLCHGPKGKPYLFADEAFSYQHLVGVAAGAAYSCLGDTLVVPGDAKASLLWRKVAPGVTACGDKMPVVIGGDGVEPEDAALIEAWIQAGAKP